ncbi:MAG: rRNA maturation RNase YbeY [bacterium]
MQFSIFNNTRKPTPRVPFEKIKNVVLGKHYELSLVFAGDTLMRRLNRTYRSHDNTTNVLSFPISKKSGEIFINLSRSAPFGVAHLLIHGLLHLKGIQHGATMERREKVLLRAFDL